MPIVVDTNSYVDVAYADTYFQERFGATTWAGLDESEKTSALLTAMPLLENYCDWAGDKTDDEQALAFPRDGDTEVPQDIKYAQCEMSYQVVVAGGPDVSPAAPLKRLKADTAELEWMDNFTKQQTYYNGYVTAFLSGYCTPGTEGGSGGNSVIRV